MTEAHIITLLTNEEDFGKKSLRFRLKYCAMFVLMLFQLFKPRFDLKHDFALFYFQGNQYCRFKHVESLWLALSLERAKRTSRYKQVTFFNCTCCCATFFVM